MPVGKTEKWTDSNTLNTLIKEEPNNKDVTKVSLTKEEAAPILDELVKARIDKAEKLLPLLNYLNEIEQRVILDILYNMDFAKVKGFKNMFKNLLTGNRIEAGWELLDSVYTKGVGGRSLYNALTLATQRTTLDFEGYKDKWDKEKWASKSKPERKDAYLKEVNRLLGK